MSSLEKNIFEKINVGGENNQKPPEDRAYRGFSTVDNERTSWVLYDFPLIKQDIINHFHIKKGEKLSDPGFGTIIWDVLYEPLDGEMRELIAQDVTEVINYDPRVSVSSINVESFETGIQINADLVFLPYNISEALRFRFDQNNGLIA